MQLLFFHYIMSIVFIFSFVKIFSLVMDILNYVILEFQYIKEIQFSELDRMFRVIVYLNILGILVIILRIF